MLGLENISLAGTMDVVFVIMIILFAVLFVGGIIIFFVWISKFKYKVRIIDETGSVSLVYDDKAKLVKKDGEARWHFLKTKDSLGKALKVTKPSKEFLSVDKKGCYVATARLINDVDIEWINTNRSDINNALEEKLLEEAHWRHAFVAEGRRSKNRFEKRSIGDWIQMMMPIIVIFISLIAIVIVMDTTSSTQLEVSNQQTSMMKIAENTAQIQADGNIALRKVMDRLEIKSVNSSEVPD